MQLTRHEQFQTLFPAEPAWRWRQIEGALFNPKFKGWQDISTLSQAMRSSLAENIPWISVAQSQLYISKDNDTRKALLQLSDGEKIEAVLMKNRRGQWSVCVSCQVGCAMNCSFCATGRMGLRRDLNPDEIVDQLRYWQYFLRDHNITERISNIVMMGMGEPLANYDNVKAAVNQWLSYTDIGATHVTISTVGLLPHLKRVLQDAGWPPVRLAISLHSADETLRKQIVPSTSGNYLQQLSQWVKEYLKTKSSNQRYVTFEYILLAGINDSPLQAKQLGDFVAKIGRIKVNLIPYNNTNTASLAKSTRADEFALVLKKCGVTVTVRQSAGQDIMAACGQLANAKS